MTYIVNCYVGRLRMLNWKSGDTGPKLTQTRRPSLIESFKRLKESTRNGR
jgi:hypothetical protein